MAVTSFADGAAGSLRAAIDLANARSAGDTAEVVIQLAPGTYELTRCGSDDSNAAGDLDLTTSIPVSLVATGGVATIRQRCENERVLDAHDGPLILKGVTITGGSVVATDATETARGGGVRAQGDVRLERATISGNHALGAPAVPPTPTTAARDGGHAEGGGLYVRGSLTMIDSTLTSNRAEGGSGPILDSSQPKLHGGNAAGGGAFAAGAVFATGGKLDGNQALGGAANVGGFAHGGGIASASDLSAESVLTTKNRAGGGDSRFGVENNPPPLPPSECSGELPGIAQGGSLWAAAKLSTKAGKFTENESKQGLGCERREGIVYVPPLPGYPGGYISSVIGVIPAASFGGAAFSSGAATITGGEFIGNRVERGSGSALYGAGDGTVDAASIQNNVASAGTDGHGVGFGGALTLRRSKLLGNTSGVTAGFVQAEAVTIARSTYASLYAKNDATLVNTTITANGLGVGLGLGKLVLNHCTVVEILPQSALLSAPHIEIHRSVVFSSGRVCGGTLDASSYSFFSDNFCGAPGPGDRFDAREFVLGLGELADNGGPVPTRALAASSVLVNGVPTSACSVSVDARGTARPQGDGCDIGAYEAPAIAGLGPTDLAVAFVDSPVATPGTTRTWTIALTNNGPRAAVPVLTVERNVYMQPFDLVSVTATGATCTVGFDALCRWNVAIQPGSTIRVQVNAAIGAQRVAPVVSMEARVTAANILAPLEDDRAVVETPVAQ